MPCKYKGPLAHSSYVSPSRKNNLSKFKSLDWIKIEMFVPLVMTDAQETEYNQMDRGDDSVLENLDIVLNVN